MDDQTGSNTSAEAGTVHTPVLLLTTADAAALCRTSVRAWRTWNTTGRIPRPICIGRKIFWRPEELRDWVAAGCPNRETWESMRQ